MGPAARKFGHAVYGTQVLIVSGWRFCITPHYGKSRMMVSEVVGKTRCKRQVKPKPLPIPKPAKPKSRKSPDADLFKKRKRPRPFNKPKPDELS
jgi:hypothetical protein